MLLYTHFKFKLSKKYLPSFIGTDKLPNYLYKRKFISKDLVTVKHYKVI